MKWLAVFLSCIVLIGCSYSPSNVDIEIDSSFSLDKKNEIINSLDEWSAKTNGAFGIGNVSFNNDITSDPDFNKIKFINQYVSSSVSGAPSGIHEAGYCLVDPLTIGHPEEHVQAVIYIWDGEADSVFEPIAKHEIGHALLVNHYCNEQQAAQSWTNCEVVSDDPQPSIMYPTVNNDYEAVEPIDVQRFCDEWDGC